MESALAGREPRTSGLNERPLATGRNDELDADRGS
jgi:hypothetical protein